MTPAHLLLLLAAGVVAGVINAVAGGGTLVTFPTLIATGLSPLAANVTNTVGVWPGYVSSTLGYRVEARNDPVRLRLGVASAVGAAAGTAALLTTSTAVFRVVVPILVLVATALIGAQPAISRRLAGREAGRSHRVGVLAGTTVAGAYGAYFGGGLGIVLLAVIAIGLGRDLAGANALKVVLSLVVNSVALVGFAVLGPVHWAAAAVVAPASWLGGLVGARLARRLRQDLLRIAVVVLGLGVGIWLAVKG